MLRYLGYGRHEADQAVMGLVEECIAQLLKRTQPRCLYRGYPLILGPEGAVDGGCFRTVSGNLLRNPRSCGQIIVFTATLSTGVGHLIQRYNKLQMSRAVIMRTAATTIIEEYCDQVCASIKEEYEPGNRYLRPRLNPGYGDFPLDCQQRLLGSLKTGKRVRIKLTNNLPMMPSKSVAAVMEVSRRPYRYNMKSCESCGKRDHLYRR